MDSLHLTTYVTRNPNAAFTQVNNELIIMSPDDHVYYRVNEVGAVIWSLLEKNQYTLNAIADHIQQHYSIEKERAVLGVTAFIETMLSKRILKTEEY